MLVIYFQFFMFNTDLRLELLGSLCQLRFSPTNGRLCWRLDAWRGKKILGEGRRYSLPASRSFQYPSSRHSYALGLKFSWPSQCPQHSIFSEARPGPYRCSTMCGASRYTGPSSPTGPSSSPHLVPGVPLAPGVADASCNSCCSKQVLRASSMF